MYKTYQNFMSSRGLTAGSWLKSRFRLKSCRNDKRILVCHPELDSGSRCKTGIRGFTLLEVMVAVAILGVIMTLVWSSTSQSLKAKERIESRDMVFHSGSVALRKISEDLIMSFLTKPAGLTQITALGASSPTSQAPTAVQTPSQASTLKTFFIGGDNGQQDNLSFTSLSHVRLFKNAKESDECKISYEMKNSKTSADSFNLIRREVPWLDLTTEVNAEPLILVEDIREFNVEYYDITKGEWVKEWDTEKADWKGRLPMAVRISLAFADPDDETKTIPMSTAVLIALGRPIDF